MASGLSVPVGRDSSGRAKMDHGAAQTLKIIELWSQPGESNNPFQEIGLGRGIIYANQEAAKARYSALQKNLFDRLSQQRRAKLDGIEYSTLRGSGQLQADLSYTDLETDPPQVRTHNAGLGPLGSAGSP